MFVKIRCYADLAFSKFESDWDKIVAFSTPKILRFAKILEQFQPDSHSDVKNNSDDANKVNNNDIKDVDNEKNENNDAVNENNDGINENNDAINENNDEKDDNDVNDDKLDDNTKKNKTDTKTKTKEMLKEIENCDFSTLGDKIEDKMNTYIANLKDLDICDTVMSDSGRNGSGKSVSDKSAVTEVKVFGKRGHRTRGRRAPRNNVAKMQQIQQNPDSLCGIVFLKEPLMAKIMFMLIVVSFDGFHAVTRV